MMSLAERLQMDNFTIGNAQVWGTVRLFPVLSDAPIEDLRLHSTCVDAYTAVTLRGHLDDPRESYYSYVPHAFVASISDVGASAAYGTQLNKPQAKLGKKRNGWMQLHRMARIEDGNLRFLPLHFAMEGYLALQFGGPDVAWEEWSREALRSGLSPRFESAIDGRGIPGLADALRVFEIHERQVGVLLFVGDVFTSAFIVPNHADYRALHRSLLSDFFGDTLIWNAFSYPEVPDWDFDLRNPLKVQSIADIRRAFEARQADWSSFHRDLVTDLFDRPIQHDTVQRIGRFHLQRFTPTFELNRPNHIGEMIVDHDGRLAYLKSFLLTQAQVKRGNLLQLLAAADWNLELAAKQGGDTLYGLHRRIENAGFGYLLKPDVRRKFRR